MSEFSNNASSSRSSLRAGSRLGVHAEWSGEASETSWRVKPVGESPTRPTLARVFPREPAPWLFTKRGKCFSTHASFIQEKIFLRTNTMFYIQLLETI